MATTITRVNPKRVQKGDARRFLKGPPPSEEDVQLATRVPKDLHHRLRIHTTETDDTIRRFTVEAIRERIAREST